ncbi:MAG: 2-hydroxyacyl-CoA dehydratase subunit D [Thermodesulfobacteriota bacterium]
MEPLSLFSEIVRYPDRYAMEWKRKTGGSIVGHFCSYTPEEIITAAGALPYRIFGSSTGISKADAHLQAYSCSLVRGALEDALAGRLDFLDGTVFPHTCDSIQRLSDIWRLNIKGKFHLDVVLPVKLNTDSAGAYMVDVLNKFRSELQTALAAEIGDQQLGAAVRTYNRIRDGLSRLYAIRRNHPGAVGSSDVHTIFRASMIMDRADFSSVLEDFLAALDPGRDSTAEGKRIVLTGGLCNMPDIYRVIESSGGRVVWDDFCTGARYFEGRIDDRGDIVAAIADRYLNRVVCPAKHSGNTNRGDYLLKQVKEYGAKGVIFVFLKFCDPHAFDYPYMKTMLEKEGIPHLMLEIEDQTASEGQLRTRCEAFMEML